MIFISTGTINYQSAVKTTREFLDLGIKEIELSGGLYEDNITDKIKKFKESASFQFLILSQILFKSYPT